MATMMLVSAKRYPPLLWGIFILFAADSMAASTPEINNNTPTAEPGKTTTQMTTALGLQNKTDSHAAAWESTHKPAIATISEVAKSTVVTTVETKGTDFTNKTNSSDDSTVALLLTSTASSSAPQLLHTSAAVSETQPSHHTTIKETATPTPDLSHQQSTAASTNTAAPATTSAAFSPAATVPQPTSITESEMTSASASASTFSSEKSTAAGPGSQNLTGTSVPTMSTVTAEPISETTHGSTFLPPTTAETSKTRTESSSTAQPVTASSTPVSTSLFSNTTESNVTSTAALVPKPRKPKLPPVTTSTSAPATEPPHDEALKTTPSIDVQPCLTPSVVKHCFIIIAFLAVLSTIFIFSTIVLCVKLSVRRHRRRPQTETEMMCISALLPERSNNYARQHNRVPNGVLVFPRLEDSDDEVGDNLTLSSFLPENDRYV